MRNYNYFFRLLRRREATYFIRNGKSRLQFLDQKSPSFLIPLAVSAHTLSAQTQQNGTNNDFASFECGTALSEATSRDTIHTLALLRKIVDEHGKHMRTFVLPWSDPDAMNEIRESFDELFRIGLTEDFVFDACVKQEQLFKALTSHGKRTLEILEILVQCCEWTYENSLRFFSKWTDQLLAVTPASIQRRLNVFLGRGVTTGRKISRVVKRCPEILFASDAHKMDQTWEYISSFFYSNCISKMLEDSPGICLRDPKLMEDKYEYIHFYMALEPEQLVQSKKWVDLSLNEIMDRHKFLQKTGLYTTPNPKKPQFSEENPSARDIFDSSAECLAAFAGVHFDEWLVFQELSERQRSDEDLERPYERIKPAQRYAFERRLKNNIPETDGELS